MKKRVPPHPIESASRLPYLWLILGTIFACFATNGQWDIPLAAWLSPFFFLRFTHTRSPLVGIVGVWLASVGAMFFFLYESQFPSGLDPLLIAAALVFGSVLTLPYLLDRLVAARISLVSGLLLTLVFPLSRVACEYLLSFSPYGSIFALAYTQHDNLPLLQIISVTGIYGVSFLVAWFASIGNWCWEQHFSWPRIRTITLLYSGLLALVLLGGGIRLTFFLPSASVVRVAAISVPPGLLDQELNNFSTKLHMAETDPSPLRSAFTTINNDLLTRSQREAQAGAKIIVWPEGSARTLLADEENLIEHGQALAREAHIYLEMGLHVFLHQALYQNRTVLLDPTGRVVWIYDKAHPIPGSERITPGAPSVPVVDTPYGRLASVICFDADFPDLMRQGGSKEVDLMLVPSDDWQGIDPWHTYHATFRAIENGYSLVRPTSDGLAMTVDDEGHVLAATDYFTTNQQTMIAFVPTKGVWTVYAHIGDMFAWLCIAGLLFIGGFVAFASFQGRFKAFELPSPSRENEQPVETAVR
jgi:apolipoprotein N-acyltransferase